MMMKDFSAKRAAEQIKTFSRHDDETHQLLIAYSVSEFWSVGRSDHVRQPNVQIALKVSEIQLQTKCPFIYCKPSQLQCKYYYRK